MSIKRISESEYKGRVKKYYDANLTKIRLGDLDMLMGISRKYLKQAIEIDHFVSGGLTVEVEEMKEAYQRIETMVSTIRKSASKEAETKVANKYSKGWICI